MSVLFVEERREKEWEAAESFLFPGIHFIIFISVFFLFLSLLLSLQLSFIFSTSLEGRCQLFQWNLDPVTLDWTVFPLKDFEV